MNPDEGFYIESGKASIAEKTIEAIRELPPKTIEGLSEEHPCSANWLDRKDGIGPRLEIHHIPNTPDYEVNIPGDATNVENGKRVLSFTYSDFNYEFSFRE